MKYKLLLWAALSSGLLSTQVAAAVPNVSAHVGSYNLVLQEDYTNLNGGHIHGKSIVGGNWTTSVDQPVGHELTGLAPVDAVTVLGNISGGGNLKALNGNNIIYGNISNDTTMSLDGAGGTITRISDLADPSVPTNTFNSIWNQVVSDSLYFNSLTATGHLNTATPNGNNGMKFTNDNSLALNVFNITTANLITNGGFDFDFSPTVPVVINVSGTGILNLSSKAIGNLASASSASNVLWNFFEAGTINFTNGTWFGSVLAPGADVFLTNGASNLEGGLAAKSLVADRELHNALYSYTPPSTPPTEEVPAPAGIFLIGLGLLIMVRRKFAKLEFNFS